MKKYMRPTRKLVSRISEFAIDLSYMIYPPLYVYELNAIPNVPARMIGCLIFTSVSNLLIGRCVQRVAL